MFFCINKIRNKINKIIYINGKIVSDAYTEIENEFFRYYFNEYCYTVKINKNTDINKLVQEASLLISLLNGVKPNEMCSNNKKIKLNFSKYQYQIYDLDLMKDFLSEINEYIRIILNVKNYVISAEFLTEQSNVQRNYDMEMTQTNNLYRLYIELSDSLDAGKICLKKVFNFSKINDINNLLLRKDEIKNELKNSLNLSEDASLLKEKKENVECIMSTNVASFYIHEVIGHFSEADIAMASPILSNYFGKKICEYPINVIDYANHKNNQECPYPIYFDDNGQMAQDVHLVCDGIFQRLLNSEYTADILGQEITGNVRISQNSNIPYIRNKNIALLPGKSNIKDMIRAVDDGIFLSKVIKGKCEITGYFELDIQEAYTIRKGKICDRINNIIVYGDAFNSILSIKDVSDNFKWDEITFCNKFESIRIGMGSPEILLSLCVKENYDVL